MTAMNTKAVNSAAGVILAALTQNRTAAGIALALDSARLLMTPEIADELKQLRDRVAELEAQREADHKTWQHDLRKARGEREAAAVRIAALEGEHYAVVHHDYRLGHDLPETGGAR
jgi:hypothetical protein